MNASFEDIRGTFLDRRPLVWSYSMLHTFRDICAHQAEARYVTKSIKFQETEATRWGNEVHAAFELRVGGGKPLPPEMQQWEKFAKPFDGKGAKTENWFQIDKSGRACDRFDKNKFGHGKLDLYMIQGDAAYIADWKTGNSKYEDPFELEIQGLLLKAKFPHLKTIKGAYCWLKEDRWSKPYDVSDVRKTWDEVCSIMATVLNYRKLGEFPKKPSGLCGWCQRWDCENNNNPERPKGI